MRRKIKKISIILLTFVLLAVNANFAFAAELISPQIEFASPEIHNAASSTVDLSQYFDLDEFNDYIVEQLKTVDGDSSTMATISISQFNIPYNDTMKTALQALIWYNSPEFFRIGSMGFGNSSGKFASVYFYSYYTKEEYTTMHAELVKAGKKMLEGIADNESLTDLDKLLLLHDRIAEKCQYDYENLLNNSTPRSSYNAYGVIVLNVAVCMGYTLAYDYLLGEIGINSKYCSSDILNHAWNIVYLNNIPYHVDITWDDPVWDTAGRVYHTNFLRSTAGIVETGHCSSSGATDFYSFPTDTTYDDYYWQNVKTGFQYVRNEYYFLDEETKTIQKTSDISTGESTEVMKLAYTWRTSGGYYPGTFTKLASNYFNLYYSSPEEVLCYDPETGESTVVFKPDLASFGSYHWIYGMEYNNCEITCEIYTSPNFTAQVKKSYTSSTECHSPTDWEIYKEASFTETGERRKYCYVCEKMTHVEEIPKLAIEPSENIEIDETNSVIFSENKHAQSIEEMFNFNDDVTYEVNPSMASGEKELLGTGTVISIFREGEKVGEYTVIIDGDLNGDSTCDVLDVAFTELCLTDNATPTEIECFAANGTAEDTIDINSFQFVVNTALL